MAEAGRKTPHLVAETESSDPKIELGLNAAIVTVREQQPHILVVRPGTTGSGAWDALPFGTFAPRAHRTLEIGLREWVKRQTGLELGYVEQLYTFGDRGRHAEPGGAHTLSVGYLALTRGAGDGLMGSHWSPWYAYFPWEDWRRGKPDILSEEIEPRLKEWAERPPSPDEPVRALRRAERLKIGFGIEGGWDEEKVLERYELLYEAGLVAEAMRDGRPAASQWPKLPELGRPMEFDHRRILATALGRLARQAEIPACGVRAACRPSSPFTTCNRRSRRSPARCCTSRTSGGSSRKGGSSRRPETCRPRPAGALPVSTASAARWCSSALPRA